MASTINAKNTSTGVVITPDASGQLELQTADTTRMTIDVNGNVGVGTSSPSTYNGLLNVKGSDRSVIAYFGGTTYAGRFGANSSFVTIEGVDAATGVSSYQPLQLGGSILSLATGGTERMRIDSSGNVGIGTSTTNPAGFGKGVNLDGTSNVGYQVSVGGTFTGYFGAYTSETRIGSISTYPMTFYTNATERMRIDSSGNLLIGRTNNPSGFTSGLYVTGAYSTTTPSGANVFINTDGSFFRSTSSIKYKTNVENYAKGLDDLSKLRPVTYQAKEGINTEQVFAGFVAEEVHEVGLTEFVQYAEDGTPDALSYGNMVALCVKAIQELKAELDIVKAELATLKGTV